MYCSLSKIGLTIKFLHLGNINTFLNKAIDPPSSVAVNEAIVMLQGKIYLTNVAISVFFTNY